MSKIDRTFLLLTFLALSACTVAGKGASGLNPNGKGQNQSRQVKFSDYRLANGLRILLVPDSTVSGLAVNLSFDVGSRNETVGQAGLANLLQNIILQNLRRALENERGETTTENKKQLQGVANQERTSYFTDLTATQLDLLLSAFARQMRAPDLTQATIDEQRLSILDECRQVNESPFGGVQAMLLELSYRKFAYRHDTTCFPSDQRPFSSLMAQTFFKTYYAPNNAVLVVVGNFNENEVRQTIKRDFGSIPRHNPPPKIETDNQSPYSLERRKVLNNQHAKQSLYFSAYSTVPSNHPDWYALNLLGDILGQGDTARLYVALVAKQLASSVPEGAAELRGQSLFQVGARVSPGVSVETVEAIIDAEIARIQKEGVTEAEMVKARSQERDYSIGQLRTPLGKANFLARVTIYYNDPNRINTELGRLLAVTAQDVQRVARKYLVKKNRAVVIVQP